MRSQYRALLAILSIGALVLAACGDDNGESSGGSGAGRATIVVTTNILGDVVENLVGDEFEVVTIMPVGADPHDFQASAQQVAQIGEADVLIVNGAGFEKGLLDVIETAEADGVLMFEAISAVSTIEFGAGGHDGEAHDAEGHDEEEHDAEGADPHFFTDPARMVLVAEAIVDFLVANVGGVDAAALEANAVAYIDDLRALDTDVYETLAVVPEKGRVLVTNHEVFGYFADRYGFEVVGTVIPSGSTVDGVSAGALVDLAKVIEDEGVPAIFADNSSSDELARTLADEVGDVKVVELFSESLGSKDSEGATYLDMVRTNAQRIAGALAG